MAQGAPSKLAAVDCTVDKALCDRFDVSGFPAVKFFLNGKLHGEYSGERTVRTCHPTPHDTWQADAMLAFLKDPAAPAVAKAAEPKWSDEPSSVVHLGWA